MYNSKYPIINVTADIIIRIISPGWKYSILLVQRKNEPYKGLWALPGGFVEHQEFTVSSALRELKEETGYLPPIDKLYFTGIADAPERDPRGRTISIVYSADINEKEFDYSSLEAGDDAACVEVFPEQVLESKKIPLAFDHYKILFDDKYLLL